MNENATMNTDVIEELSNRYLLFRIVGTVKRIGI